MKVLQSYKGSVKNSGQIFYKSYAYRQHFRLGSLAGHGMDGDARRLA